MECIRMKLIEKRLNKEALISFREFIYGQTCMWDEKTQEQLIYAHDFLRWWRSFDYG